MAYSQSEPLEWELAQELEMNDGGSEKETIVTKMPNEEYLDYVSSMIMFLHTKLHFYSWFLVYIVGVATHLHTCSPWSERRICCSNMLSQ